MENENGVVQPSVEQKKKSNAPLIILIVLLFIIAVAGSSFGGYMFGKSDAVECETESTTKKVDGEISKEELNSIIYRMELITNSLYKEFPIKNVDDISNQGLLRIALTRIANVGSGKEVENYIKQVVGYNANVKIEDYICPLDNRPLYVYDNGWYKRSNENHGHGGSSRYTKIYFRSATVNGDTLTIKTNVIYGEERELGGPGDTFYDGVKSDSKKLFSIMYDELDAEYEKIKDTLPVTIYTFKNTDYDGYNLVSVTIE